MLPMHASDVKVTWANVDQLINDFNYSPKTPIEEGIQKFTAWYKNYYSS